MAIPRSRFGTDPRVDPDARDDSPDRTWPEIDYPQPMLTDHRKYFTEEYRRLEWEQLWTRVWTIAGRVSDVSKPGEFFTYSLGTESFIITRTSRGELKAYYNVCHHRGMRLAPQEFGRTQAFTCPFHSWTWNLDGSLKHITDRESFDPGLVCDNPRLTEVRCDSWAGFVFITMDDEAPPLRAFLGELVDVLDRYEMERMEIVTDMETDWPANWKTVLDAFMEGYHAHIRHPELLRWIDDYHFQHDLFANGHSRMIIPMGLQSPRLSGRESVSPELAQLAGSFGLDPSTFDGKASAIRAALPEAKRRWAAKYGLDFSRFTASQLSDDWNLNIFPNITLNAHPEGVLVMRFRPHPRDPERCWYDVWTLARKTSDASYCLPAYMPVLNPESLRDGSPRPQRVKAKLGETSFGMILDQDAETVPFVQQGMKSRAFKGLRLSYQEQRLRHFYVEYDRYLKGTA
jgi:phenylpropionate dioxygenase-like ring-hydroxylating dioxygenase large terminal subunit